MSPIWLCIGIIIFAMLSSTSFADDVPDPHSKKPDCFISEKSEADLKKETEKFRVMDLSAEQWEFVRGIYAMNPATPPGLPFGDRAILVMDKNEDVGTILFIDNDLVCTPMAAPKQLIDMLADIKRGVIHHEGATQ